MTELKLYRLVIDVTFNPDSLLSDPNGIFSFGGDIDPVDRVITVPQGIAMIIFNLKTGPTNIVPAPAPAVFQTSPVQWFSAAEAIEGTVPALTPHMFNVQRIGDETITIIDYNSHQSPEGLGENHVFNLVVAYNGNTYGSDPTIVNEPPMG